MSETHSQEGNISSGRVGGPDKVQLSTTSTWGPFALWGRCRLSPAQLTLVNTSSEPLGPAFLRADPLREEQSGTGYHGDVEVIDPGDAISLEPGEAATVTIQGSVSAQAGTYASMLRTRDTKGEACAIPITVRVSAWRAWGLICMVIGLALIAITNTLDFNMNLKEREQELLLLREETHSLLEKSPPPQSSRPLVEQFDEAIDDALSSLHTSRGFAVRDRRLDDAQRLKEDAEAVSERLHADAQTQKTGQAEVEAIAAEWKAFEAEIDAVIGRVPEPMPPTDLQPALQTIMSGIHQLHIASVAKAYRAELAHLHRRTRLRFLSGAGAAAATQARLLRRGIRRASADIDKRSGESFSIAEGARRISRIYVLVQVQLASLRLDNDGQRVEALLGQARTTLNATPTLDAYKEAHAFVEQAYTELVRLQSEVMLANVRRTHDEDQQPPMGRRTMAVFSELEESPPTTEAQKVAVVRKIADAYLADATEVGDETLKQEMSDLVERTSKLLKSGQRKQAAALVAGMRTAWMEYTGRRLRRRTNTATAETCSGWHASLRQDLGDTQRIVRSLAPSKQTEQWSRVLDALQFEASRVTDDNCLNSVVQLGARHVAVSNAAFSASLAAADIPGDKRLAVAESSGVMQAILLSKKLLTEPRELSISVRTPTVERYSGREVLFEVANLNPVWREGVQVSVDFGDGTPPSDYTAEELRQNPLLSHTFDDAGTYMVTVEAKLLPADPSAEATPERRGYGAERVTTIPSPVTAAQTLSDTFFTASFAIALLVATSIYYWRFSSQRRHFGVTGLHYIEAFALGAAISIAANDLPSVLHKFVGG